ncbi:MAG: carboxypeptidase-like regulatory domain-containing protein, partial [Ignavibacteriaceae bacterium]
MESFPAITKKHQKLKKGNAKKLIMYFNLLFLFSLVIFINSTFAQETANVFGKIVDSKTGEELIGANVFLEGTSIGAASDLEGNYNIKNIPPAAYT